MSFDGVFTHAMVTELKAILLGGRLSKIHQPYDNEIILVIRSQGKNHKLLLSAHSSYARIQLTDIPYQNPSAPANFCMMLRKYLEGAVLEEIEQIENDRIIHFHFKKRDELGDLEQIILIVELMGRHSTIVLVNQENGKILDTIKHLGPSQNTYRTLLPGAEYVEPPKQTKLNPFKVEKAELFEILSTTDQISASYLQKAFQGIGTDTGVELAERLERFPQEKLKTWETFFNEIASKPQPTLYQGTKKTNFTPIPFISLEEEDEAQTFDTLSQLLDHFYAGKAEKDRVKQQAGEWMRKLENEYRKNQKKIKKLTKTLQEADNAEIYRQKGELLNTYLHQVERGATEITVENYYEENQPLKISLNPALSPAQNAQKYFQKYQKLKNGVKIVQEQLAQTKQEINYLESVLSQLEIASPQDLDGIRQELIASGYLRQRANRKTKMKEKPSQPQKYQSSDGTTILVGRNNLQNDQLTLKTAKKSDIWLHAKNIPGSHVIIRSAEPSEQTLFEAAQLAAYFSKYRLSASVPVDYVAVKHIRKPNGAKPGYVIYENQKTIYVTPEQELIEQLTKVNE